MDDIPKLLAFFRECKANNPQFFYEFQLDDKNVVKNVFWSHASQQGDYAGTELLIKFYWDTQFGGWAKKKLHKTRFETNSQMTKTKSSFRCTP